MVSTVCLILSISILFFILKFRVHIHVTYTRASSGRRAEARAKRTGSCTPDLQPIAKTRPDSTGTRGRNVAGTPSSTTRGSKTPGKVCGTPRLNDLVSALMGLGSSRTIAKEAAQRALFHQDPDLETALRRAIDYASRSNAA